MRAVACACAWLCVAATGCFRDAAPAATTAAPPAAGDDGASPQHVPERSWKRVTTARACDDAASFECVTQKFGEFRDRACGCAANDRACGEAIMTDLNDWTTELARIAQPNPTPTAEQSKAMADVATELSSCLTNALATPPPPAP
ncbi:MAG: hypothetical protein KF773_32685 [Deltaproteobacteria bacterium]|nr:hypothetical protein [Deltaproteobacteria bacterium]